MLVSQRDYLVSLPTPITNELKSMTGRLSRLINNRIPGYSYQSVMFAADCS